MKVIITGASGFIGRNLILRVPKSWEVIALFNQSSDFPDFINNNNLTNITSIRCDLTKQEECELLAKERNSFDLCIYLAANGDPRLSAEEPLLDFNQNALALVHFLTFIKVKRFVFFSSGAVYDGLKGEVSPDSRLHPILPYAISKMVSEQYIKFFAHKGSIDEYVILRFFGAYGPYEPERKVYTKLIRAFCLEEKDEFIVSGDGKNLIDAMYVDDTIDGILKVAKSSNKKLVVDFCSGNPHSLDELVQEASSVFGKETVKITHEGEVPEYIMFRASPRAMEENFSFKPEVSLKEGLLKLADFLKKG